MSPSYAVLAAVVLLLGWGLSSPQRLNRTLFAVLFLVPVTADPGYPIPPVWTILLASAAIACLGRLRRLDPEAPLASAGMLAFLLPAICAAAALFQWTGARALIAAVLPLLCYAVIIWHLVDEARREPDAMRQVARWLAWVGVPIALLAIYQRVTGTWPVLDQLATSNAFTAHAGPGRSAGTTGHPIIYGSYCMAMMGVSLALRGRWWQVPFAANAIGLLLSGSRSAWIGIAAALVLWYLTQQRKITARGVKTALISAGSVAVLLLVGPRAIRDVAATAAARLTNLTGSPAALARYKRSNEAWSGIWDSFQSVVFGNGPEAHVQFFQEVGVSDGQAQTFDNSYLTLWYDFGAISLIGLLVLLMIPLVKFKSIAFRMLFTGFVIQIWFFDFYLWPCAASVLILAICLGVADSPALPSPALGRRSRFSPGLALITHAEVGR
ncbi:hypothetical protein Rhe02_26080 [Rhizocola hellebori]|uniref:O-antigen ligase-related domain-containing protein n=1 Tax=Rhizocola hellebori TaxID=1392758 RepID=A0A8J3VFX6_9ACTN|nr:hypothetical protein Rhe02_26080 [Rhizocola hellebori]